MRGISVLILCIGLCLPAAADSIEDYLDSGLASLQGAKTVTTSVGPFYYQDKELTSEFSGYLSNTLEVILSKHPKFQVFPKDKIEEIMQAQKLSLSGLIRDDKKLEMGVMEGWQAAVSGRYFITTTGIELFLKLLDLQTGIAKQTKINLPRAVIPGNISLIPYDIEAVTKLNANLGSLLNEEDFTVFLDLTRGNGSIYKNGDDLYIVFSATRDCYILLYNIDKDGNKYLIFPNKWETDNFIKAETRYIMPENRNYGSFRFTLRNDEKRPINEQVLLIASTKQFDNINQLAPFKVISDDIFSKLIEVSEAKTETSSSIVNYSINP